MNRYAEQISTAWNQARSEIMNVGRLLIEAKESLPHGQFTKMIESELPFSPNTAQRLMVIAQDNRLSNPAHVQLLPTSWGTLHEITKLDHDSFEAALAEGVIRPDARRQDIVRFRHNGWKPHPISDESATTSDLQSLIDGGKRFGAILADPPWSFEIYNGEGRPRSAERHYNTMSLDDIKALPVGNLADENAALFLWSVMPQLPEALEVMDAWGFEYKTCAFTWVKKNKHKDSWATGMGHWTRSNAELCLLGVKGNPLRLSADIHQIIEAPRTVHSQKPSEANDRIQKLLSGPYLELFARRFHSPMPSSLRISVGPDDE